MIQIFLPNSATSSVRMATNCGLETRDLLMVVSYGRITVELTLELTTTSMRRYGSCMLRGFCRREISLL